VAMQISTGPDIFDIFCCHHHLLPSDPCRQLYVITSQRYIRASSIIHQLSRESNFIASFILYRLPVTSISFVFCEIFTPLGHDFEEEEEILFSVTNKHNKTQSIVNQ